MQDADSKPQKVRSLAAQPAFWKSLLFCHWVYSASGREAERWWRRILSISDFMTDFVNLNIDVSVTGFEGDKAVAL